MTRSVFAVRVKAARLRAGITQAELADRLSVEQSAVCRWESGRHLLGERTVLAIAQALDMSLVELLTP